LLNDFAQQSMPQIQYSNTFRPYQKINIILILLQHNCV
jgi:hypothetical protein